MVVSARGKLAGGGGPAAARTRRRPIVPQPEVIRAILLENSPYLLRGLRGTLTMAQPAILPDWSALISASSLTDGPRAVLIRYAESLPRQTTRCRE